jgi:type IV pilus assembly protein PilA
MINALLKRRMENKKKNKKGFTLVELIVVLVIIAILAAVLVPTLSGYIGKAKRTGAQSALKNVVTAAQSAGTELLTSSDSIPASGTTNYPTTCTKFVTEMQNVGESSILDGVGYISVDTATGVVLYATYTDGTYYATYTLTSSGAQYTTGKAKDSDASDAWDGSSKPNTIDTTKYTEVQLVTAGSGGTVTNVVAGAACTNAANPT